MEPRILVLNLPGLVLKCGSRWYNVTKCGGATLRYYPYPWFMGYTVALLKTNGFEAKLIDAVAMEWSIEQTLACVESFNPTHIVCEPTWASVGEDSAFISSLPKSINTIAVGNYATNFPYEALTRSGANFVVIGEYEFSILEFFKSGDRSLPVNFIGHGKTNYQLPELIADLDIFPYPERDDVPFGFYNEPSCFGKNLVMVSSRGCRLRCGFCNVEAIYGRHVYRRRSAVNVVDEMEYVFSKYDIDEIYFDDDNMVSQKNHIDGICKEILRRKCKFRWLCMGDGLVDDETLELLAAAGCVTYKFGLEHLDIDVLRAIPKPLKPERSLRIITKCRELGIRSYVNLIVGLPHSTYHKDIDMIKRVIDANPDLLQFAIATPYPGTNFYKNAIANGWLISNDPSRFDATGDSAVFYPNYKREDIRMAFEAAWHMWYRHVLTRKWSTLWFFLHSEIRRNGLFESLQKTGRYALKFFDNRYLLRN